VSAFLGRLRRPREAAARGAALFTLLAAALGAHAASAAAAASEGWWRLSAGPIPANLAPGHEGTITLRALNLGNGTINASKSEPVTLTAVLPPGITLKGAADQQCGGGGTRPVCARKFPNNTPVLIPEPPCATSETGGQADVSCTFEEPLDPFELWEVAVGVVVANAIPSGTRLPLELTVHGGHQPGGAELADKTIERGLEVSSAPTGFGLEEFEVAPENAAGETEATAGAHPFQFTTTLALHRIFEKFLEERPEEPGVPHLLRNLRLRLPPGLVGDPQAVAQCDELRFETIEPNGVTNQCPADSAVGVAIVDVNEPLSVHRVVDTVPVFNLRPALGEPARFGFSVVKVPITLDTAVDGGDYRVEVKVSNASQAAALLSSTVTIWGVPGSPAHEASRGWDCLARGVNSQGGAPCTPTGQPEAAFLSLPTACAEAESALVEAESWAPYEPPATGQVSLPQLGGCSALEFRPALLIKPTDSEEQPVQETQASTPTGLDVKLKVPQSGLVAPGGRAEADLRNTVVTLPPGVQLSPSAATGLASCSEAAVGYEKANPVTHTLEFKTEQVKPETAAELAFKEEHEEVCPKASKIGTVEVTTPLLEKPLEGSVYLASQEANPFGTFFALYLVIRDPVTGVDVKIAGRAEADAQTGQITSYFEDAPQLPFEELELKLMSGPRASLATPRECGTATSAVSFEPWSGTGAVGSFGEPGELQFAVAAGPAGSPCPAAGSLPFAPSATTGTTSTQAGAYTAFNFSLERDGSNQQVKGVTVSLPPGLAATIANVPRCPEPQASTGDCGAESLIGSASATVGLGSSPFTESGGRVYLTGPYQPPGGPLAPFGLSVVLPTEAGGTPRHPVFNFGNVVTRSAIYVDHSTAAVTIASQLPLMVNTIADPHTGRPASPGVPVQLRRVDVHIERPGNAPFQFNPTNCSPLSIGETVSGDQGATASLSQPYQVTGCPSLAFSPVLEAQVESHWTKVEGTGLKVTVRATPGQANIHKTKIVFPLQLPSRLTTIQKACPEATFATNPATCPEGSVIGRAKAVTPVLNGPLEGPAYLVSHGGAAFPDAEFVLQGEGITLVLDGQTDIHDGITSSTFNSVPDAPVSTFEVDLPRGPHSAFTGYGDLCHATKKVTTLKVLTRIVGNGRHRHRKKVTKKVTTLVAEALALPTILGGQNETTIQETLPLKVTGCKAPPKKKKKKRKRKASAGRHARRTRHASRQRPARR
jgi:hypothetical protein